MTITRTQSQLLTEAIARGCNVITDKKYSRQELVDLMAAKSLEVVNPGFGLKARMSLVTPMLCYSYKHLKPSEKVTVMTSKEWMAQEKIDGCRAVITYHPSEGFRVFSRNISVTDFLPVEYTDKVLFIKDGKVTTGSDWKGVFTASFILDSEIIATGNIDTTAFTAGGVRTTTELNAVSALLAIEAENSKKIQAEQASVAFKIFDILEFDGNSFKSLPYRHRLAKVEALMPNFSKLPFSVVDYTVDNKEEFYASKIAAGGEGIVLKNLNAAYIDKDSRRRDVCIKRKRSMEEVFGRDIDAFVTGFVPSTEGKQWENMVGALKVSVILRNPDGTENDHWIGSVSSMPLEVREQISELGEDGKARLKKEFFGRVLTINGQDCSGRSQRFMHCTADWARGFRTDKTQFECVMEREFLESQIL